MATEDAGDRRIPSIADSVPNRIEAAFDDFTEVDKLGSGGNADVTKVEFDGRGPDTVAIKQPRMQGTLDQESIKQFVDEAETWNKIDDHNHIVGVLDWNSEPLPWIALEYMDGGDLNTRIGDLSIAEALWIGVGTAKAVRHAHRRGVAHLDLKPENILFQTTEADTWDIPKVTDWGLAKMLLDHSKSVEGLSPEYAAPEQFDADSYGAPDDMTDIYAIGAVVYASLTGNPPFVGASSAVMQGVLTEAPDPPSETVDDLPDGTDAVILKALAKNKDARYESVLDLRRDLETLLERELGTADDEAELIAEAGRSANITDTTIAESAPAGAKTETEHPSITLSDRTYEFVPPGSAPNDALRNLSYLSLGIGSATIIVALFNIPGLVGISAIGPLLGGAFLIHGASQARATVRSYWGGMSLYGLAFLISLSVGSVLVISLVLLGIYWATQGGESIDHPGWVPDGLQTVANGELELPSPISKIVNTYRRDTTDTTDTAEQSGHSEGETHTD